jgi:Fur family ferric uptake transcriptional regulator
LKIFFIYLADMRLNERDIRAAIRKRGYKITPQRSAVIKAIAGTHEHLTPAEIHDKAQRDKPRIGLVTVYRTMEILAEVGLICELHSGGNCRSYLLRRPAVHHHHLICSECGQVVDFTDCDLSDLERRLSTETGFHMQSHLLEFLGRCPSCQKVSERTV